MTDLKPEDEYEHEALYRAIACALFEDGLDAVVCGVGILTTVVVSTLTDKFRVSIRNGLAVVGPNDVWSYAFDLHNGNISSQERSDRFKEFPLADPNLFKNIINFIREYRPPTDLGSFRESVSKRLDKAQRND